MLVLNMRLNEKGGEIAFFVSGATMPYLFLVVFCVGLCCFLRKGVNARAPRFLPAPLSPRLSRGLPQLSTQNKTQKNTDSLGQRGAELLALELADAGEQVLRLLALGGRRLGVLQQLLEVALQEVVGAVAVAFVFVGFFVGFFCWVLCVDDNSTQRAVRTRSHPKHPTQHKKTKPLTRTSDGVSDHKVGEAVDVAARLEHRRGRHGGALHLEHALLQHKVLAPRLRHVLLDRAAGRAIVVEAGDGAVDLERGDVEEAALQGVGQRGAERLARLARRLARRRLERLWLFLFCRVGCVL